MQSIDIVKLKEEVESLKEQQRTQTIVMRKQLNHLDVKVDGVAVKLDSASKKLMKRKTLLKRPKKDSAEVAHIEHVIFHELLYAGVDTAMSKIIVAIAKHESRSFESGLFNKTNNLFGMTYPPRRATLATGHKVFLDNGNVRRFCSYASVSEATRDMVLYLKHWKYPLDVKTPEQMVRLMKSKRYFEAPEKVYLKAVKRHLSELTIENTRSWYGI